MSLFTQQTRTQVDEDVRQDLDLIVSAIDSCRVEYSAIYLVGAFGRGEGSVRFDGQRWRAVNDYDLVVIAADCERLRSCFARLGSELAYTLQVDFVDIGCISTNSLTSLQPTMQNYDLKFGSILLAGKEMLNEVPDFETGYLPSYELIRLLCNRSAGLLTAMIPGNTKSQDYCTNQFLKACIAVGDVAVYIVQGYHHSYRVRLDAFHSLAESNRLPFDLPERAINAVLRAYKSKLIGTSSLDFSVDQNLMQLMVAKAYCAIASCCTNRLPNTVLEAEWALRQYYRKSEDNRQYIKKLFRVRDRTKSRNARYSGNRVLFAQPFFYCHLNWSKSRLALAYLCRFWSVPGALRRQWNAMSAVQLWEKFHH